MAGEDVVVVGVGMMTAVGLSTRETAASVRAGTARFTALDWRDRYFDPFTVAEVPEDGLPELNESLAGGAGLTYREARLLRLAALPLRECLNPLPRSAGPVGLDLALPEHETTRPLDRPLFLERLARQAGGAFDPGRDDCRARGRAGGLAAVGEACRKVREGQVGFAVAGGVDTYRDLYVLGTLDAEQRVKSARHLDGFIPGEGAGFLLLAGRQAAAAAGLMPLGVLSPVATAVEEGHLYSEAPYRGEGLAAALQQLLQEHRPPEPIRQVYSSMNGESHWAKEWGVAFLRNRAAFAPGHGVHHPADSFGDTGAACGPLLVGLAAWGAARGYRPGPCLVYGSSDRGARAVLTVRAA
jgi:3-oxoacyl-[acyl-carrier-protein] synthase-1